MKPVCKKWLSLVTAACVVMVAGAVAGVGVSAAFVGMGLFVTAEVVSPKEPESEPEPA